MRFIQQLFVRHPAVPFGLGLGLALLLTVLLLAVDAFAPDRLPVGFSSRRQVLGGVLLLILLPAYLLGAWGWLVRRSALQLEAVDALLPGHDMRARLWTPWTILAAGAAAGAVYAVLFNLPVGSLAQLLDSDRLSVVLVLVMIFLWTCVGVVLGSRLYVAGLFVEAGRRVPLDPFDQSTLEPFARAGMADTLVVIGALVLTVVQSIDARFRPENYLFALLVALPAALVLLLRPMSSVHARLKAFKARELEALNGLIRMAPKSLDAAAMAALEPLLQRRDRTHAIPTWPLNVSMISRLLVYGVIPPAAWVAAALVERWVDVLLGR